MNLKELIFEDIEDLMVVTGSIDNFVVDLLKLRTFREIREYCKDILVDYDTFKRAREDICKRLIINYYRGGSTNYYGKTAAAIKLQGETICAEIARLKPRHSSRSYI